MKFLQRTAVDKFKLEEAVKIEDLSEKDVIPVEKLCEEYEKIELDERKLELFLNGVRLTMHKRDGIYQIVHRQRFIGLGVVEKELLKRDVVI